MVPGEGDNPPINKFRASLIAAQFGQKENLIFHNMRRRVQELYFKQKAHDDVHRWDANRWDDDVHRRAGAESGEQ